MVASIGRSTCGSVAVEAMRREVRLARLTIVVQGGGRIVDQAMQLEADHRGVELKEMSLSEPVGPARARFIGSVEGHEEFVGFLDDDIAFHTGSLSDLVTRCQVSGLGGACGVVDTSEISTPHRVVKAMMFRSIFRDARPGAVHARGPVPGNLLSGGMTVYRRAVYANCAPASLDFPAGACGEDVELSFSASRMVPLVVDPSVRVRNRSRHLSVGPADATPRAIWRLAGYRSFAARHARTRRHWIAYGVVLVAVVGRGVGQGAGMPFLRAAMGDAAYASRAIVRPPALPPRRLAPASWL